MWAYSFLFGIYRAIPMPEGAFFWENCEGTDDYMVRKG
jgi:hypothetical protein